MNDMAFTLIKDMWFLMGHIMIMSVLIMADANCIHFWAKSRSLNSKQKIRISQNTQRAK
jgi:hypothetical protein